MASGWHRESFRHYLAAKGVSTRRYLARQETQLRLVPEQSSKSEQAAKDVADMMFEKPAARVERSPGEYRDAALVRMREARKEAGVPEVEGAMTKLQKFRAAESLKAEVDVVARGQTQVGAAIKEITTGNYLDAFNLYNMISKDPRRSADAQVLKASLESWAINASKQGVTVPDGVYEIIGKEARQQIDLVRSAKAREAESPFTKQLREISQEAAIGTLGALPAGLKAEAKFASETYNEKLKPFPGAPGGPLDFPGITEVLPQAEQTPFFMDNFFLKGPQDTLTNSMERGFVKRGPSLTGEYGDAPQKSYSELVQERMDTLFNGRMQLADVDYSAFDRGASAFERGDREQLLDSIVDLKSQEAALRDRWALVQAAHNQLVSAQNNDAIYGKVGKNPVFSNLLSDGASRITDQTKKLNAVKAELKKANDRVFSRRRILEYRLKRLDRVVPPEVGAPEKVRVLDEPVGVVPTAVNFARSAEQTLRDVRNPLFDNVGARES